MSQITIERLQQALINADAAGDDDAARIFAAEIRKMQAVASAPVTPKQPALTPEKRERGYLESLAAGIGKGANDIKTQAIDAISEGLRIRKALGTGMVKGVGNVGLGAQNLIGMGLEAAGAQQAGEWLQNNAAANRAKLASGLEPYKQSNPITAGVGEFIGEVVPTLPIGVGLAKGVEMIPRAAKAIPTFIQALKTGGAGQGAGNIATRMAAGGLTAAGGAAVIDPEQLQQAAMIGAIIPGGITTAQAAGKTAKAVTAPLMDKADVIGKTLTRMVGGEREAQAVVKALRESAPISGMELTAGQAGKNVGLSSLEDAIKSQLASGELARKELSQNKILADRLRSIGTTREEIEDSLSRVNQSSRQAYEQARTRPLSAWAASPEAEKTFINLQQRIPKDILAKAKELALASNIPMNDATSVQGLHWIKNAIDELIEGATPTRQAAFKVLKNDLVNAIEAAQPAYKTAREAHRQAMIPINQQQIGLHLYNKLVPSSAGDEILDVVPRLNISNLATALRNPDLVARQATKYRPATFEKTMSPEQQAIISNTLNDAKIISLNKELAQSGNSATARRMATGNILSNYINEQVPMLNSAQSLMSRIPVLNRITQGVSGISSLAGNALERPILEEIDRLLANNPQGVANLIEKELQKLSPTTADKVLTELQSVGTRSAIPSILSGQ